MLEHNKRMQDFLKQNGIKVIPKRIDEGSLRGCWRLAGASKYKDMPKWTDELRQKLTNLGFVGFDGMLLNRFSGNGGVFQVFVRTNRFPS